MSEPAPAEPGCTAEELLAQAKRLMRGRGEARNYEHAVELFDRAAQLGDADAHYWLGKCYLKGLGCTRDPHGATTCLERAASMGHAAACLKLGDCFARGTGAPSSRELAAYWYRRAAARGENRAVDKLLELAQLVPLSPIRPPEP